MKLVRFLLVITALLCSGCGGGSGGGGGDSASATTGGIVAQPNDQTVAEGRDIVFVVSSTGKDVQRFQWQTELANGDFADIEGATSTTLKILAIDAKNGSRYRVRVTDGSYTTYSQTATLSIAPSPPTINSYSYTNEITAGSRATFSVSIYSYTSGMPLPVEFNWQRATALNPSVFSTVYTANGTTESSYSFIAAPENRGDRYRVQVSRGNGIATSDEMILSVREYRSPPVLASQPASVWATAGDNVTFSAGAIGTEPLSYQWEKSLDGINYAAIPSANSAHLTLGSVDAASNGTRLRVIVSNTEGSITSNTATLNVAPVTSQWTQSGIEKAADSSFEPCFVGTFLDPQHGWIVCGSSGHTYGASDIWRTTDGGQTWRSYGITLGFLFGVSFVDAYHGWVVGNAAFGPAYPIQKNSWITPMNWGTVFKTTDGGVTWTPVGPLPENLGTPFDPDFRNFKDVFFVSITTGWVVGDKGVIYKTTDGGSTWHKQASNFNYNLKRVQFTDSNFGWVLAQDPTTYVVSVLRTDNGGATWTPVQVQVPAHPEGVPSFDWNVSMSFTSSAKGWVSSGGRIFKTEDGGQNWVFQSNSPGWSIQGLLFTNESTGYVQDLYGEVYRTINGGNSFSKVVSKEPGSVKTFAGLSNRIFMQNTSTLWSTGYGFSPSKTILP